MGLCEATHHGLGKASGTRFKHVLVSLGRRRPCRLTVPESLPSPYCCNVQPEGTVLTLLPLPFPWINPVITLKHLKQLLMMLGHLNRLLEKSLGRNSKKLSRIGSTIVVNQ